MEWNFIDTLPEDSETYLVADRKTGWVAQARYRPRLRKWTFPSAAMAFEPTHWMPPPEPPK